MNQVVFEQNDLQSPPKLTGTTTQISAPRARFRTQTARKVFQPPAMVISGPKSGSPMHQK